PVSGSLTVPASQATYTFSGAAGQHLFLDVLNSNGGALAFTVVDSANHVVLSASNQNVGNSFTLSAAGTYTLVVGHGATLDATGSFQFTLFNVPADVPQAINQNTTVSGSLTVPGQTQSYVFQANLGQKLAFAPLVAAPGIVLSLKDPSGNLVFSGSGEQLVG